jgi:hypothetical protein
VDLHRLQEPLRADPQARPVMTEAALARHRPDHLWRLINVALPTSGVVRLLIWSARLTKSRI